MESGVITESTADTLMGYGYMIFGVQKVDLKIDMDMAGGFQKPKVEYDLHFSGWKGFLYRRAKAALAQGGLKGKLKYLIYVKLGATPPVYVEESLKTMALEFLPKGFSVTVNVK